MKILILILLIISSSPIVAQRTVSFDEALTTMLDNNRTLKGARYGVDAANEELRAARGLRSPRLELMGGYALMQHDVDIDLTGAKGVVTTSLNSIIKDGVSAGIITPDVASLLNAGLAPIGSLDWRYTIQKRSFGTVGLSLAAPIYTGGRINIANRAAKLEYEASSYELNATQSALLTELVERYFGVILLRNVVMLRHELVDGVQKHLDDAIAMEQEGILAHSAILYLQYRKSEAERDLAETESKLKVAMRSLMTTMGVDEDVNPNGKLFVYNDIYSIDYYVDASYKLNPILQSAYTGLNLAHEGVKLSRAELLPEVVAMGSAALYSHNLADVVPRWAVGIGVNMTIFDGLGKERRYRAAKTNEKRVVEIVEDAEDNIALLVEKEYYAVINALESIEASKRSREFAEDYLNSTYEGFREGVVSSADLVDARIEYTASGIELLNAAYQYVLSLARLLEAAGLSAEFVDYHKNGIEVII